MRQSTPILWVVQACLVWLTLVSASPVGSPDLVSDVALQARDTKPFPLRILPLGASITMGYKSPDGNGYRKWLRQQLRYAGWEVDMIGTMKNGTMHDNDHDGHVGWRIDRIADHAKTIIPQQPNLILLNAGTNDALQNYKVNTAGERMDSLLTYLFDNIPNTTIILSTLTYNGKKPKQGASISSQYTELAAKRRAQNDSLVLADMSTFIRYNQLVDKIHPTAAGYEEMASVWWAAIQQAEKEGLLKAPKTTSTYSGTISKAREKALDDSTSDPDLPAYTAPAQPTVSLGSGSPRAEWHLWTAFQIMMGIGFYMI
ncbi:CAZyme family CE3 [Penicillium roqueforti]|uniref:Esterase, SGNH hydrolase-type n=1 Tax=Penicillium roqueforti (strain FM164) TaxID=1365484 RepID=W6QFH1_PENRF|nr:CAZyme family CE3 [Penicillium roqueforti]CDM32879.1 Esterase, SGNH hydrolase-type [Penicillium roqueforti FM164]KAF9238454.1 CAZyme family CE3 [Penicillium roqueforti]KAI1830136.1 CAZyme family CE3 [Penicillium roqueforti]KAI2675673.1 CAZyme family CE3 [Penicillium roqueforti]KAI2735335.1 CAZyme family CE3 [Penicillium roqueforti]